MEKRILDFIEGEKLKKILKELEELGKITRKERFIIEFLNKYGEEVHPKYFLDASSLADVEFTKKEIEEFFEKVEKEEGVFLKLKGERKRELIEKVRKAIQERETKIFEMKIGKKEIKLPYANDYYLKLVNVKINFVNANLGIVEPLPEFYVYILEPKSLYPSILITKEKLIEEGTLPLRLKQVGPEEIYQYFSPEEWVILLRKIYRGTLRKEEIQKELAIYGSPICKIKIFKPFEIEKEILEDLTPDELKQLIQKITSGFHPIWAKVGLGLSVRVPKKDWLLPFAGTHAIIIDRTNLGKTLMGELTGEAQPSVSIASLVGFATADKTQESIIHLANHPLYVDELEEEKRELGRYMLNLLKAGETTISRAGKRIHTKTWSSLVFTANAEGRTPERMAEEMIKVLSKISPNFEGLASRFALIDYYNFNQEFKGNATRIKNLRDFVIALSKKFGKIYALVVKSKKGKEFIYKRWDENYQKQLEGIRAETTLPDEIYVLMKNLPHNYLKLNCLAIKMSLWDFPEFISGDLDLLDHKEIIGKVLKKAEEYRGLLQMLNIRSFEKLSTINVWPTILELRIERLTKLGRKLLSFIIFAHKKGFRVIDTPTIRGDPELEDKFTKIFGEGYSYVSKLIAKLTDENKAILESFGLMILPDEIKIVEPMKFDFITKHLEGMLE